MQVSLYGQDAFEINGPDLRLIGDELEIEFALPAQNSEEYEVELIARGSDAGSIYPGNVSGDIGQGISSGNRKQIRWNLKQDDIDQQQRISVRIVAYPLKKKYARAGLLLRSAFIPGLGPSLVSRNKGAWASSFIVLGGAAASYYFNRKANTSYQSYLDAETRKDNESYYSQTLDSD